MDIIEATHKIELIMDLCGLFENGWKYEFGRGFKLAGLCVHHKRTLRISKYYLLDNDEYHVQDLILHEVAHALVGCAHGHDGVWRAKCKEIGCAGTMYTDDKAVHRQLPYKYKKTCIYCGETTYTNRRTLEGRLAHGKCCDLYNNGKFSEKYLLIFTALKDIDVVSKK